ncbi:MAG: RNA 3'-phosphate cyclase [candidate division NC10 bacterium]|nr:RNA 3'-phosphate cyclase [candidate division NC10 bacterium]MDE2320454.1 RNA 3'-phosphate cyclase [candidate division NC10 bacterium]
MSGAASGVLRIDGSYGEGGGQILRTAVALSAVLGRPVELIKIRAGRTKPGLQPQHLSVVKTLAEITGAEVHGAELGSSRLYFAPGPINGGLRRLDVGTAGAVSLVFQAILAPLTFAGEPSILSLTGGTHVPWSPPAPYISEVFLPIVEGMGLTADWQLERGGFYPKGGGQVRAAVQPLAWLSSIDLTQRGALLAIRGISAVAGLPRGIAERQANRLRCRLIDAGYTIEIKVVGLDAACPGNTVFVWAEFERARAGFGALGERGKPAERVADEAADGLLDFLAGDTATEGHLADQLAVLMALADGRSALTTARVSQHLLTNLWTIQQFLPITVLLEGRLGGPGRLSIDGVGLKAASWGATARAPACAPHADR